MNAILQIKDLKKSYDDFALKQLNFTLNEGTITGFIGENGAGKTTTLKIIMGLLKQESGEVIFSNELNNENIGYLSCNKEIYSDIQIKDITKFVRTAYRRNWNESKYQNYIHEVFNLNENKKLKELSTGMKVKYFLTLELAKQSKLLLLDEPTTGLDPLIRNEVLQILKDLADIEKRTIFFSSHITEDIEKIADYVIYIDNGTILLNEDKQKIKNLYIKISYKNYVNFDTTIQAYIRENGVFTCGFYILKNSDLFIDSDCVELPTLDEILVCLKGEHK